MWSMTISASCSMVSSFLSQMNFLISISCCWMWVLLFNALCASVVSTTGSNMDSVALIMLTSYTLYLWVCHLSKGVTLSARQDWVSREGDSHHFGHAHFRCGVFISSSLSAILETLTNPLTWAHNLQQLTQFGCYCCHTQERWSSPMVNKVKIGMKLLEEAPYFGSVYYMIILLAAWHTYSESVLDSFGGWVVGYNNEVTLPS